MNVPFLPTELAESPLDRIAAVHASQQALKSLKQEVLATQNQLRDARVAAKREVFFGKCALIVGVLLALTGAGFLVFAYFDQDGTQVYRRIALQGVADEQAASRKRFGAHFLPPEADGWFIQFPSGTRFKSGIVHEGYPSVQVFPNGR